ncbi:regulation of nuclear pre-mRNA domain-containing protein 1B-like, partial [Ailuropoda melanoleuca]|uniref:regulation of nuclear pre-mRNA domain-containing protein 1B-like n=1 Tax=Ailuropoda melanoleuca TaxID=9646 RepID=UPI00149467DC
EADEGCKKPLERLLNIWQERSVYGSEFIQQLKLSMEDSSSPQTKVTEEKKSLKRTFQQMQEEEDDDYPGRKSVSYLIWPIVTVWHRELRKAKSSRKLTFLYLANDVIQNSKKKGPEFTKEFESVLVDAFSHVAREADEGCKKPLERLLNIWQERSVYGSEFIQQLKLSMEDSSSPQTKVTEEKKSLKRTFQQMQEEEDDDYPGSYSPQDPNAGPLLAEDLIKALQDLENAASGDATVRQKIASLPQEVQDVSLLEKITDKEAAERLSKTVDEACLLL